MKRKAVALFLVLVMLLSLFPTAALAEGEEDEVSTDDAIGAVASEASEDDPEEPGEDEDPAAPSDAPSEPEDEPEDADFEEPDEEPEPEDAEIIPEDEEETDAVDETREASDFILRFSYDGQSYTLTGGRTYDLRQVVTGLGLSGEVTAVQVSDEELFDVRIDADGDWLFTSCQAFDTDEWMLVTIDGVSYTITVSSVPVCTVTTTEISDFARWLRMTPSAPYYEGQTIVVYIAMRTFDYETMGCRLEALIVTDTQGHVTEITQDRYGNDLPEARTKYLSADQLELAIELSFTMPASDVTLSTRIYDPRIHSWGQLQAALESGGTVILTEDVTAGPNDTELTVPSGVEVTLDLNGYTVDRGLSGSAARTDGGVIVNHGTLTVTDRSSDNSGTITGGSKNGDGGGIWTDGSLTLTGGTVTGNTVSSGKGGGIYYDSGALQLSGSPVLDGNTADGADNNLCLNGDNRITVAGELTEASIGISLSSPLTVGDMRTVTSGYGLHHDDTDPAAFFHSDDVSCVVELVDGEVQLVLKAAYVERSWNGSAVVSEEKHHEYRELPANGAMTDGWYYLNKNVTVNGRISLTGDTWLILGDGYTLDVKGLYIPQGYTLTIYGQSGGTGKIYSHPSEGAAIGATSDNHPGGSIVIHGGTIEAEGHDNCAGIGSNDGDGTTAPITIYGGNITAKGGGNGAGIGGGRDCDGGEITIYGGEITVKGGSDAAAIGGGEDGDGGTITINGGTVTTANDPNENAAAIGGGENGDGGTITINGGRIIAYSRDGACIGGGEDGNGGTITINGGTIKCWDSGEANGARIGGGCNADGGSITINGGWIVVSCRDGAGIGGGEGGDGGTILITGGTVIAESAELSEGNGAAIGGGSHRGNGGNITITGGTITAHSKFGAGIGGGRGYHPNPYNPWSDVNSGRGGTISISGGRVSAIGECGFGIGAGGHYDSFEKTPYNKYIGGTGNVSIGGSAYVEAQGGVAGIGGDGGTITILGGTVIARGSSAKNCGRGIMMIANEDKGMGHTYIRGGHVEAYGYGDYPGISSEYMHVTITGGDVYAYSPEACGIGGRQDGGTFGDVRIEGAGTVVRAKSDEYAGMDGGFHEDKTIRGGFSNGPGVTIEVWSPGLGDFIAHATCTNWYDSYAGAKITVGPTKETAQILPAAQRENASRNKDYIYSLIEPCDHKDADGNSLIDEDGICFACAYGDPSQMNYVEYSWENGQLVGEEKPIPETAEKLPDSDSIPAGWYYVSENLEIDDRVSLQGDTFLILGDGYTLDVKGLYIPQGYTLTIYGQSGGTGKIYSHPSEGAAIGAASDNHPGGSIVIHGGTIEAKGHDNCAGIGSNDGNGSSVGGITIYNGDITATGGSHGAGIGGGRDCDGGTITIYGGIITATGKDSSAGIGGGDSSGSRADTSTIKIYGGEITANGDSKGAGIGGGEYGSATIEIHNGHVIATGGSQGGAGIGSGADGAASTITIDGGTVYASASSGGAGIGNGKNGSGSTITLGWTEATRQTISIDASSYSGAVTLTESFYNLSGMFLVNAAPNLSAMAGSPLLAWGGAEVHSWADLQAQINATADDEVITLDSDYYAEEDDIALQIVNGRRVIIDLNGHTLHRNLLNEAEEQGSVLYVDASSSLTILDSAQGGSLTGGNNLGPGGGIVCAGTLTINGGLIWHNKTAAEGGGVYLAPGATLHMNGGVIEENSCGAAGGGVYVSDTASMTVSGNPVVMSNKRIVDSTETDSNVLLMGSALIGVTGELVEYGASIYVWRNAGPGIITSGYSMYNTEHPSTYFRSNEAEYSIVLSNSEASIDTPVRDIPYVSYTWTDHLERRDEHTDDKWVVWPEGTNVPGGMYVLNEDVTVNGRVLLQDDTWLILCDGCTLDLKGLYIPQGKTLTIYGQNEGTGKLCSHPGSGQGGAAIGGYSGHDNGSIVIHGGTIEAKAYDHCAGIGTNDGKTGGSITIYGGTITAIGGSDGAGIGGGLNCGGGTITVYGGDITANGPTDSDTCEDGAGIGGGRCGSGGTITIWGGTITTYSRDGAGIGGGDDGDGGTITIHGGTITSTKVNNGQGAGIGGGCDAAPGTITINGGLITTVGGKGAGIGGGKGNKSGGTVAVNGGVISASGSYGIGGGEGGADVAITLSYTDATKESISITADSFNGAVTLEKSFKMDSTGRYFEAGGISDNSLLTGGALTAWVAYTVSIDNTDPNGTVSADKVTAHAGDEVVITVTPNTGYEIDALTVTDGSGSAVPVTDGTFTMPASSVTISAAFRKIDYTVTVNASGRGTVTANCASANYGDTVVLSFAPDDGDCFLSTFTIKDAGNHDLAFDEQTNSFVMPASNVTITAVYSKTLFRITVNDSVYGSVAAPEKAEVGETVTLTVTPEENCRLASITAVDAEGGQVAIDQDTFTFTMPEADVTITPVFEISYLISIEENIAHGTITADRQRAFAGETVTLTPVPDAGYGLAAGSWILRDAPDVTVNPDGSFIMPAQAVTASASFEALDQTLTLSISGAEFGSYTVSVNGTERITVTEDTSITVKTDDEITVALAAAADGRLNSFTIDGAAQEGSLVNNTYIFVMPPSAAAVSAEFETVIRTLGLALNGGQYGDFKVSVNGVERATASTSTDTLTVRVGDEITITFLPTTDGQLEVFYLEDSVGSGEHHHEDDILNNQYTFTMPARPIDTLWAVVRFGVRSVTETVSYIDESGATQTVEAIVLTGNETENYHSTSSGFYFYTSLGKDGDAPTWYVVKQDIDFHHDASFLRNIELTGDVRIIVADGATLTVQGEFAGGSLSVFGQTAQAGTVTANSIRNCDSLTVASGGLTVSGNVNCRHLAIYGGTTNIAGTVNVQESVILGCRGNDDSITIGTLTKYNDASATIVEGQTLTDGKRDYSGGLSDSDLSAMAGKTLMKAHEHSVETMTYCPVVVPTCDPATGEYTDGTRAHYHCDLCGGDFVEGSGDLEPVDDLSLPYFVFWKMPSVSGVCYLRAYNGADADVIIPETVPASLASASAPAGTVITHIDNQVFAGHTELETVTAGSGLCSIGAGAFAGCTGLTCFTTTAAQAVSYDYDDPNGLQDSFDGVTGLTIQATHASGLYQAAVDYGFTFRVTDRHSEPTWTWANDCSSATATFNCNGTCELDEQYTVSADTLHSAVSEYGTVYTATVTVGGEVYTGTKTVADTWAQLQAQISAAPDGATITLARDYTALEDDTALMIPYDKTITLDLNGHTLDRGLADSAPLPTGYVILIRQNATLNLVGSGTITGGSAYDGGGIYLDMLASLNMSGGTVTGNKAINGGGVYVNQFAALNMSGGSITGNEAQKGAVYVKAGETMNVSGGTSFFDPAAIRLSGSPVITGNTGGNVYLADGEERPVIEVTAAFADTAAIGVTAEKPGVFTSGWADKMSGSDPADTFVSDNADYAVSTDTTGEAALLSCWAQLQAQINAAADGATITLMRDYTALESDTALRIPYGKTITLDMNGHTLDRGLADSASLSNGYVIVINHSATLNLVGDGTITGGSAFDGGGINLNLFATLNMSGGTVTGNKAINGGGVFVNQFAALNMSGGSITGNEAENGAVYVKAGETMNVSGGTSFFDPAAIRLSGSPVIIGNTGGNVYLADGEERPVIEVTAAFTDSAAIGVTAENPPDGWLTIASGLTGEEEGRFFTSDVSDYLVVYDGTRNEVGLYRQVVIRFIANNGTEETMDPVKVAPDSTYTLPQCGFTAPPGKLFQEWSVQIGEAEAVTKQPGDTITVCDDTTVTAVWADDPSTIIVNFDACGGTAEPAKAEIGVGAAIGALPTPTREGGWVFLGWFTEPAETAFVAGEGTPVTVESVYDEDATVYAHWRLPGDINGDGSVNNKDLTRLQRYLKGNPVEVVVGNLDVNGDGRVNNKDLTRLQRHLKGANVEIH